MSSYASESILINTHNSSSTENKYKITQNMNLFYCKDLEVNNTMDLVNTFNAERNGIMEDKYPSYGDIESISILESDTRREEVDETHTSYPYQPKKVKDIPATFIKRCEEEKKVLDNMTIPSDHTDECKEQLVDTDSDITPDYKGEQYAEISIDSPSVSTSTCSKSTSPSIVAGKRLYNQAMERLQRLEAIRLQYAEFDDESSCTSSVYYDHGTSPSIVAGERLFNQAMERLHRLEISKKKADEAPLPFTMTPFTEKRFKNSSICDTKKPRYLHLYELSKNKVKVPSPAETQSHTKSRRSKSAQKPRYLHLYQLSKNKPKIPAVIETRSPTCSQESKRTILPLSENARCNRLYNLSKNQRMEGKKRRETIQKASQSKKERSNRNEEKISLKDAERLYYKGVRHLLDLDVKRIQRAAQQEREYQPFRFNKELKEKVLKRHQFQFNNI
jgi:hypothetical protein